MNQHVDGHSSDGMEWIQQKQGFRRTEAKDILAFADDNKGLSKRIKQEKDVSLDAQLRSLPVSLTG